MFVPTVKHSSMVLEHPAPPWKANVNRFTMRILGTRLVAASASSRGGKCLQCSRSVVVHLRRPTDDTLVLAKVAADGMRFMYIAGYQFIKAGVILVDQQHASVQQRELDLGDPNELPTTRDRSRLMAAMDVINTRFGKGTVHSGGTGKPRANRVWTMKQERRTPAYTTCLEDVPVARA